MQVNDIINDESTQLYREVSFEGCKLLCQSLLHDLNCSMIIHMHNNRSCILSPMRKLYKKLGDVSCENVAIYRRHRCTGKEHSIRQVLVRETQMYK